MFEELRQRFRFAARRVAGFAPDVEVTRSSWVGDFESWAAAGAVSEGWQSKAILGRVAYAARRVRRGEAVFERDGVSFSERFVDQTLLGYLLSSRAREDGALNVIDFGGSLGSTFFQYRPDLGDFSRLRWGIVEQPPFVEIGRAEFASEELLFFESLDEALESLQPDIVLASGSLQYIEGPWEMLGRFLRAGAGQVLLWRTAFQAGHRDRLTVHMVPPTIYRASYPAWFLGWDRLKRELPMNYVIEFSGEDEIDPPQELDDGERVWWANVVLRRDDSREEG